MFGGIMKRAHKGLSPEGNCMLLVESLSAAKRHPAVICPAGI